MHHHQIFLLQCDYFYLLKASTLCQTQTKEFFSVNVYIIPKIRTILI